LQVTVIKRNPPCRYCSCSP